ncbi:MAG: sodium-independent anion transporter [Verrucomicrobiota bacterium]
MLILRVRKVLAMDATGLQALEDLLVKLRAKGKHLVLSAPHTQPLLVMAKAGFLDRIGRENVCPHIDAALARARDILGLPPGARDRPVASGAAKTRSRPARTVGRVGTRQRSHANVNGWKSRIVPDAASCYPPRRK